MDQDKLMCQHQPAEMDKDRAYDELYDEWCMLLLVPSGQTHD